MIRDPEAEGEFEWTATMININRDKNPELLDRCPLLKDYMTLISQININRKQNMPIERAVDAAVQQCIKDGILTEFLRKNRQEVLHVCMTEFSMEAYEKAIRKEGREEGREEFREETITMLVNSVKNLIMEINAVLTERWN